IEAAPPQLRRHCPPLGERRILCAPADQLVLEVRGEPVPTLELPQVHDLRPRAGGTDRGPYAETLHVALCPSDWAPVRGHVVHVARAVVPDDVDEFVDVDLLVHRFRGRSGGAASTGRRYTCRCPGWYGRTGSRTRRGRATVRRGCSTSPTDRPT